MVSYTIGWEIFVADTFRIFHDSMYYVNILRFLFSQWLKVTMKFSLLSNSSKCDLKKTHGGQGDGGYLKS